MKKLLMLVLTMILSLCLLVGCGNSDRSVDDDDSVSELEQQELDSLTEILDDDILSDDLSPEISTGDSDSEHELDDDEVSSAAPVKREVIPASSATKDSPVPLGYTYTWSGTKENAIQIYEYTYSFAIYDVKPITIEELEKMDVDLYTDENVEYRILDVSLSGDIKIVECENFGYDYLSSFIPNINGPEMIDGKSISDFAYSGFDDALVSNLRESLNSKTINVGETGSYSVDGKIIVPVYKDQTSYFIIRNDEDDQKLYFVLEEVEEDQKD